MSDDNWFDIKDKEPEAGDRIIAELEGCKVCNFAIFQIREGEGLGHIKRWKYTNENKTQERSE